MRAKAGRRGVNHEYVEPGDARMPFVQISQKSTYVSRPTITGTTGTTAEMISQLVGTKQAPAHRLAMLEAEARVAGALRRAAEAQGDIPSARAYSAREATDVADAREAARQVVAIARAAAARRHDSNRLAREWAVAERVANGGCADDISTDAGLAGTANAT